MRAAAALVTAAAVAAGAYAGWRGALQRIPYRESDRLWRKFQSYRLEVNTLSPSFIRSARSNDVPMDNADTITRAAMMDLAGGPLLLEADVPAETEYWSVSVFGHNADTLFVANDQELGPGPYRLLLRRPNQPGMPDVPEVVMPAQKGFLLIRMVMPDRNDREAVQALKKVAGRAAVSPVSARG